VTGDPELVSPGNRVVRAAWPDKAPFISYMKGALFHSAANGTSAGADTPAAGPARRSVWSNRWVTDEELTGRLAGLPGVVVIRPAGPGDVAALGAIATAAYRKYVARIGREPAPMTADYAEAVRDGQTWVAVDDGKIAGFVVLIPEAGYLLLENVAVRPAAQGRGIGVRLLTQAEDHARDLGLREIRLYTNEAMTENLAYYARHGYTETHRAEQDGYRRVFFRKLLG
jgi:ribosomal protein S18 acetylase RimI-like enzyme